VRALPGRVCEAYSDVNTLTAHFALTPISSINPGRWETSSLSSLPLSLHPSPAQLYIVQRSASFLEMSLDRAVNLLETAAPLAGMVPVIGEQLKSTIEVATQICKIAKVCLYHPQLTRGKVIKHIILTRVSRRTERDMCNWENWSLAIRRQLRVRFRKRTRLLWQGRPRMVHIYK
jgi:hypothetical protein